MIQHIYVSLFFFCFFFKNYVAALADIRWKRGSDFPVSCTDTQARERKVTLPTCDDSAGQAVRQLPSAEGGQEGAQH